VEGIIDQIVDDPFDLGAFEHEHDLSRREVDAVVENAALGKGRRVGLLRSAEPREARFPVSSGPLSLRVPFLSPSG
jgi:hypothetical protein